MTEAAAAECGWIKREAVGCGGGGLALDDGDELHETAAGFFEEAIDIEGMLGVLAVDDGEGVEVDRVLFQLGDALHHAIECGCVAFVYAVEIVEFARAIDGDADKEAVLGEEGRPFIVDQGSVGLEGVVDGLAGGMFGLEGDDGAKEIDAKEGGLTALPCEVDFVVRLRGDVLLDVALEDFRGHLPARCGGVEGFFLEVEAVFAVEVADGADGLGHDVKTGGRHRGTSLVEDDNWRGGRVPVEAEVWLGVV